MARLLHTVILYRWRSVFEFIPLESQIEKFQNQYYDAIAQCNKVGNSNIFIEFMLDMFDQVLDDVIVQINKANVETSEYVKKLLDVMQLQAMNHVMKNQLRHNKFNLVILSKMTKLN